MNIPRLFHKQPPRVYGRSAPTTECDATMDGKCTKVLNLLRAYRRVYPRTVSSLLFFLNYFQKVHLAQGPNAARKEKELGMGNIERTVRGNDHKQVIGRLLYAYNNAPDNWMVNKTPHVSPDRNVHGHDHDRLIERLLYANDAVTD